MTTEFAPAILTADELSDPYREVKRRLGPTIAEVYRQVGFKPHPEQLEILCSPYKINMVSGAMQSGKTFNAPAEFLKEYYVDLVKHPGKALGEREYWVAAHRIEDTYYEWNALKQVLIALGLYSHDVSDPAPIIYLNDGLNTTIKAKFTADTTKLSGVSPLGIIVCEAGKVSKKAIDYLILRTVGAEAWMYISGTFEEEHQPWFTARFLEWTLGDDEISAKSFNLPMYSNLSIFPGGKNDPKIKRARAIADDDLYMQRVEGLPIPPKGLVYPEFDVNLHVMQDYQFDPDLPLYMWHDPGFRHYTALLFAQHHGGVIYVFDEIYIKGFTTEQVAEVAMSRPWWVAPIKILGADPYYSNRKTAQSEITIDDIWLDATGLSNQWDIRYSVEARIDRVKVTLRPNPETRGAQILFHHKRCRGTLSEFGVIGRPPEGELHPYKYKVDDDGYRSPNPIDRNNDAMDALGNGLLHMLGPAGHAYDDPRFSESRPVSTPESRGEYNLVPGRSDDGGFVFGALDGLYDMGVHPSTLNAVSTPESRGEYTEWFS